MTTHIVETTYSLTSRDGRVIKEDTIRTQCGREFPAKSATLAERSAALCPTCKRMVGR